MVDDYGIDTSELNAGLHTIAENTPYIIDQLLLELIKAIRHLSRQLVPVESGHLRGTIRYKTLGPGAVMIYAYTRQGGIEQDYAVQVHEDLEASHAPGKQAKYIEHPLLQIGGTMPQTIAQELLRRLATGQGSAGAWRVAFDE